MRPIKGVIPVLITPLDPNGDIDKKNLENLVLHLISKDIGGLWVLGTGSEDMNLTFSKRLEVAETVTNVNRNKVPILLGCSFFSFEETLKFIESTKHLKFNAYHYMPYHNLLSLDRVEWIYKKLADICPKPLWMYTSANWGKFIPPQFISRLSNHPNISGIKFSTSNSVHIEQVLSMANNDFQVITAVVKQFFSSLAMGAKAGTTVEACPHIEPILAIYNKFFQGDYVGSLSIQKSLNRFLEKLPKEPGNDNFLKVAEIKYILSKSDLCKEFVSGYYRHLTKAEKCQIDKALEDFTWKNF